MSKTPFFTALILIDVWNDTWVDKFRVFAAREAYGRIIDTVQCLSIADPFYHTLHHIPIHSMFKEYFREDLKTIETIQHFREFVPPGSPVLVGGGSFGGCMHYNPVGVINLIKANYQVFTHPGIIMLDWESENQPTYSRHVEIIESDKLVKWRSNNLGIYRAARYINDGE